MAEQTGDDDPMERAEYERALEHEARTRNVLPSRRVGPALTMSPITVYGTVGRIDGTPLLWLGGQVEIFVQLQSDGRPMGEPPEVIWSTSDPTVLAIRDTSEQHNRRAVVTALQVGEAKIIAEVVGGPRQECMYSVRVEPETQWF